MQIDMRSQIEAAIDVALNQERLPLRTTGLGVKPMVLPTEKWDRIVDNAERRLRQEGTIRP